VADLRIAVLPGDGVGPEVTSAGLELLHVIARDGGHRVVAGEHPIGWAGMRDGLEPLPARTLAACRSADAVLLGAVGDPSADRLPPVERPVQGLLQLRQELGCYANLRPVRVSSGLVRYSAVRPDICRGTDILIVRELGGGIYYGEPRGLDEDVGRAWNTLEYDTGEIERIARVAFGLAAERRGQLTSVDKANVLEVSRLWRSTVESLADDYPSVATEHMLVDRAALEVVVRPDRFDVILTANLFGDILSDGAAALAGSLGPLGSASLGGETDLYEPVHGSAPDIAGSGVANPLGAIASVGLMLEHTFGLTAEARRLEAAVDRTLAAGHRTPDLSPASDAPTPLPPMDTVSFTAAVTAELTSLAR